MKIFPFDYDLHEFQNGLRLVTVPTPWPAVVSQFIVVRAGSRNEVEEGRSGFAHFFEHMMFRGTPKFPPARYETVLQETGAASNAFTDDDQTVYHTTLAREDFERVLEMEADRFLHLDYSVQDFRTEAQAILGEYNKDSAEPVNKLYEVLRDHAFDVHTYKHTTMGFLRDIERMPEMYDYSRTFFDRFYRPEYTTIVVAGDVVAAEVRALVERYWGEWKRGSWRQQPQPEPAPNGPRRAHVPWPTHTLPYIVMSHRAPAYSDDNPLSAALDIAAFLGFSDTSPLYQELVLEDQLCDVLYAAKSDHVDPYLFSVVARVKEPDSLEKVHDKIVETLESFVEKPVDAARLDAVKHHLRYRFAIGLDNSESVALNLAHYLSLRDTPETINRLYSLYETVTPETIQAAAREYLGERGRTTVTLTSEGR